MIDLARRGRGRAIGGLSPSCSTALRGAMGALLLASAGAAQAVDECGVPEDGEAVCTPDGNPYPTGISYVSAEDLALTIRDGVVTEAGARASGTGDASISIAIEQGATIINSGFFGTGVTGDVDGAGNLVIDSAGEIWTHGFVASGIRALAAEGSIAIRAAHVDSTGGSGIQVGGGTGPVRVETTGTIRATDGFGLFGPGTNSVAGIFVFSAGDVEVVNSGLVEQIGDGAFDPDGSYVTTGGITVRTNGNIVVRGEGAVETSGFGATGIALNGGGTIELRQAEVTAHGDAATAVGAAAPGNVTIDVDSATSDRSIGIIGVSTDGDVAIRFGTVNAAGLGAYGESRNGSVAIAAGDVTTAPAVNGVIGSGIQIEAGLDAQVSLSGAVSAAEGFGISIQNGVDSRVELAGTASVDATYGGVQAISGGTAEVDNSGFVGGGSFGIWAAGETAVVVNEGEVEGYELGGILAHAVGAAEVSGAGSVFASGDVAFGIQALGETVSIEQSEVAVEGAEALGVSAIATGDVEVFVGRVSSLDYGGVQGVSSDGGVTIGVDSVEAVGFGLQGFGAGAVDIEVGDALVTGAEARAVIVQTGVAGRVTVTGEVQAPDGFGVVIQSEGDALVEVDATGSVFGGITGAYVEAAADEAATIRNAGVMGGGAGYALQVDGGTAEIFNTGTIEGGVILAGGDDLVENDGLYIADGATDLAAGDDLFDNRGTLDAALPGAGTAALAGLETLASSGRVSLADGEANDELAVPGDYEGEEGELLLDVLAGEADLLVVEGAATGRTFVAANGITGLLDTGTLIVRAGAGSSADAFTIEGLNIGFVEYGIRYDAGTGYSLVGAPGDAAIRTARYVEAARNVWQDSSDAWSAQMRGMRDAGATGPGFWIQARGSVASRDGVRTDAVSGIVVATDTGYRQDHFGTQLGYDFGRAGDGIGFGLTAGYGSSDLGFGGTRSRLDLSAVNAGAYAAFASGPFFANLLAKYDHLSGEARDGAIGLAVDADGSAWGATAEAGARLGSDRLFAEPVASLSWMRADLDGFSALASEVDLSATDGWLGRIGARFGSSWTSGGGARFAVHAGGHAVKGFGERDEVAFSNNGQTLVIENDRPGWFGEALLGLSIAAPGGVTGYFEAFGTFGGDDTPRGAGGRAGIRVAF